MKTTNLQKTLYALSALALAALLVWAAWALLRGSAPIVRIRAAAVVGSVLLLVATFESIRRTQLKEGYALLWVIPSLAILLLACGVLFLGVCFTPVMNIIVRGLELM